MTMRDDELTKEGWERKSMVGEPRLSELVELYQSLGLEVHLEPIGEEGDEECRVCFGGPDKEKYMVIYTRSKEGSGSEDSLEDLF